MKWERLAAFSVTAIVAISCCVGCRERKLLVASPPIHAHDGSLKLDLQNETPITPAKQVMGFTVPATDQSTVVMCDMTDSSGNPAAPKLTLNSPWLIVLRDGNPGHGVTLMGNGNGSNPQGSVIGLAGLDATDTFDAPVAPNNTYSFHDGDPNYHKQGEHFRSVYIAQVGSAPAEYKCDSKIEATCSITIGYSYICPK